ncbi:MAG: gliding motility-associated transporter ATP-binding subunit GldA [Bacteroidota bacterium]
MSIQVEHLSKLYKQQKAIDDLNFNINSGEIVGFLGPNGAGKTTTMKILTGYIPPSSGKAFVNGLDVEENAIEVRKLIGYLPEHNPLYTDMYVKEYLEFVASIYKLSNRKQRVDDMIELTGLTLERHKKIGQLSKGYRQRVGLAQAIIHNPKVLILDEPTSGLDPNQIAEIRNLITNIGKEKTVLLSTHIMQEVEAMCTRVMIINKGVIVANGQPSELKHMFGASQAVQFTFNKALSPTQINALALKGKVSHLQDFTYLVQVSTEIEGLKSEVFKFAVEQDLILTEIKLIEQTLEEVFKTVTK